MTNLRSKLIRLAYQQPHLRADLMPLLRQAAEEIHEHLLYDVMDYFINTMTDHIVSDAEALRDLKRISRRYTNNPKFPKKVLERYYAEQPKIIQAPFRNQQQLFEDLVTDAWSLSNQ